MGTMYRTSFCASFETLYEAILTIPSQNNQNYNCSFFYQSWENYVKCLKPLFAFQNNISKNLCMWNEDEIPAIETNTLKKILFPWLSKNIELTNDIRIWGQRTKAKSQCFFVKVSNVLIYHQCLARIFHGKVILTDPRKWNR